ncbi:hypothetical protein CTA1_12674, partial [Colletotrichum tanaceti]
ETCIPARLGRRQTFKERRLKVTSAKRCGLEGYAIQHIHRNLLVRYPCRAPRASRRLLKLGLRGTSGSGAGYMGQRLRHGRDFFHPRSHIVSKRRIQKDPHLGTEIGRRAGRALRRAPL